MKKKQFSKASCVGTTKIGERGQIVIPSEIRKKLGTKTGEKFIIFLTPSEMIVVVPVARFEKIVSKLDKKVSKLKRLTKLQ